VLDGAEDSDGGVLWRHWGCRCGGGGRSATGDGNGAYTHPALYALCTISGTQVILQMPIALNPATESADLQQVTPTQIATGMATSVTLTQIS
jgi:hypothetical protein